MKFEWSCRRERREDIPKTPWQLVTQIGIDGHHREIAMLFDTEEKA
jgi:hypothetical protein